MPMMRNLEAIFINKRKGVESKKLEFLRVPLL